MSLVLAKCTNCGANIEVDPVTEAGICQHCGSAYITQKAIVNYNTSVINNNTEIHIDASVAELIHVERLDGGNLDEINKLVKTIDDILFNIFYFWRSNICVIVFYKSRI